MSLNKHQFRSLISETLKELNLYSDAAVELLMMTAATESNFGEYIRQTKGPAKGFFQCEPVTHDDIMKRWLPTKPILHSNIEEFIKDYVEDGPDAETLEYNIKYAIMVTRLFYLRVKEPLPAASDIEGLAAYYKKYYNTYLGKGTVDGAIRKYKNYCM